MNSNPNQLRRLALSLLALAVWVSATLLRLFTSLPGWAILAFGSIALVAVGYIYARIAYNTYLAPWAYPTVEPQFDTIRIVDRVADVEKQLDKEAVGLFAGMLLRPQEYFVRIAETVSTASRSMTVNGKMQLALPSLSKSAPLPLLRAAGRQSSDSVRLRSAAGEDLATLDYQQRLAVMGAIVRRLVHECPSDVYRGYIAHLEQTVVYVMAAESPNPSLVLRDIQAHLIALATLGPNVRRSRRILSAAAWMIESLIVQRPVMVILPGNGQNSTVELSRDLSLSYESRWIARHHTGRAGTKVDALRDRIRLLMGVRPTILTVPLGNASLSRTYHLEVIGPPGTYLARQEIAGVEGVEFSPLALKARNRFGQRYGHIRIVGDNSRLTKGGQYVAHFLERMPGSFAPATFAALAACVLIWIATFSKLRLSGGTSSDLVAVLLAVPAIMGGWTGFDRQTTLFGGSLASRFSSLFTVILSLIAAAYFALGPRTQSPVPLAVLDRPGADFWFLLSSIATMALIAISYSWLLRSIVQSRFLEGGVR